MSRGNQRSGKREDLGGLFVRSSWEANWARLLRYWQETGGPGPLKVKSWGYEQDEFEFPVRRGTRFYKPDFKVILVDDEGNETLQYHEVKGFWYPEGRTKLQRMQKYYPEVQIVLIQEPEYKRACKEYGAIVPGWEPMRVEAKE
jgi:hypothetical protein